MSIKATWKKSRTDIKELTAENWQEESKKMPLQMRLVALSKLLVENVAVLEKRKLEQKLAAIEQFKAIHGN